MAFAPHHVTAISAQFTATLRWTSLLHWTFCDAPLRRSFLLALSVHRSSKSESTRCIFERLGIEECFVTNVCLLIALNDEDRAVELELACVMNLASRTRHARAASRSGCGGSDTSHSIR